MPWQDLARGVAGFLLFGRQGPGVSAPWACRVVVILCQCGAGLPERVLISGHMNMGVKQRTHLALTTLQ